jgi:hypothetical protein
MSRSWSNILVASLAALLLLPIVVEAADEAQSSAPQTKPSVSDADYEELLLNREKYFYSAFGRRDPFGSLIKGKFAKSGAGDLLDIGELSLVGSVWGETDTFAVVQDSRNRSHMLRVGDKVVNGRVLEITESSLTVQHYFFGETANVTIYMEEGEGK